MDAAYSWYQVLVKPSWAPPSWLFGPVWTVLYAIIAMTFGTVVYKTYTGKLSWLVALPFVLNLIFNSAFTPIQFGLKNNVLASIDILCVLGTLVWALVALHAVGGTSRVQTGGEIYTWIIYANIPYLLWVTYATILQLTITWMNWK